MAEKKRKTTPSQNDGEQTSTDAPSKPAGAAKTGHVRNVAFCPIGLALSAVQPMKPEVVEHLLVAGREFFLAAKALLEVRADDLAKEGGPSTFEKIDIG
jgi:hypothetical protein